jgi:glycolate oxidase iron-sulfur subunit
MSALEHGRLAPSPEVIRHLDLCLGCRACETACPSGVPYGALIESARPYIEANRALPSRWGRRLLARVLASPRLGRAALAAARRLGGARGLGRLADRLPIPIRSSLSLAAAMPDAERSRRLPALLEPAGEPRGTAVLLPGCAPARLFPGIHLAAAGLLQHAGVRVIVPRWDGCCGALAMHLGAADLARAAARRAAKALAAVGGDWIVTVAAGCGAFVREYDRLRPDDAAATAVAHRARDALELLAELGLPPATHSLPRVVTVHDPCHLAHGQGVRAAVRELLAAIPDVRLVELEEADTCCGSAGTYNLTEPAMATRLLARKLDRIAATGADVATAANPGCQLQIRAGAMARRLPVEIVHPLELLAAAHGLEKTRPQALRRVE